MMSGAQRSPTRGQVAVHCCTPTILASPLPPLLGQDCTFCNSCLAPVQPRHSPWGTEVHCKLSVMLWVPPLLLECTIPRCVLTKQSHAILVTRRSAHQSQPSIPKLTSIFQFSLHDILSWYAVVFSGAISQPFEVMTHNQTFLGLFTGLKFVCQNQRT
jgi:hypothetical protein